MWSNSNCYDIFMESKPINEIIAYVELRETARDANRLPGIAAISTYRRKHKQQDAVIKTPRNTSPSPADKAKTGSCPTCH